MVQTARKTQACQNLSDPADKNKARAKQSTKKTKPANDRAIRLFNFYLSVACISVDISAEHECLL